MTDLVMNDADRRAEPAVWKEIVARYQQPSAKCSIWQLVNTLVPYAVLWYLMYRSLSISYWLTLPLVILASGFLVRIFIVFHDCGHGSFFQSRKANDFWGVVTGILTITPYYMWRWEHAVHHASSGDLNRRGRGDMWTLTVQEYLESSRWRRFAYRLARNPVILFVVAPLYLFIIHQRLPTCGAGTREQRSVMWTNLAVVGMAVCMSWLIGWKAYLIIQLSLVALAGSAGVWLFYVQHQFDGVYWERGGDWDYADAALKGSSFYRLPKVLQWFSGNIGFHHIHHLSPRIPNYNLERCHRAEPFFQAVPAITLVSSCKSFTFRLWDEQHRKLVGYGRLTEARTQHREVCSGCSDAASD